MQEGRGAEKEAPKAEAPAPAPAPDGGPGSGARSGPGTRTRLRSNLVIHKSQEEKNRPNASDVFGRFFFMHSFDQAPAHPAEGKRKDRRGEGGQVNEAGQKRCVDMAGREGAGEIDDVGERQHRRCPLRPKGEVFDGEERPAEEKHGRDEQKDRQVEQLDAGYDRREDHSGGAEGKAPEEGKWDQEQPRRVNESGRSN